MVPIGQDQEHKWAHQQIEAYRQVYPRYAKTAQVLQQILEKATKQFAPQAIIQTRPKSIPSFAEKAICKKKVGRYSDPLVCMTDLCGGQSSPRLWLKAGHAIVESKWLDIRRKTYDHSTVTSRNSTACDPCVCLIHVPGYAG